MRLTPNASAEILLDYYSFDLLDEPVEQVAADWLDQHPAKWVIAAIIEAIYQGRFRKSSVEQVLSKWHRLGKPEHSFDVEFADLVCGKLFRQHAAQQNPNALTEPKIQLPMEYDEEGPPPPPLSAENLANLKQLLVANGIPLSELDTASNQNIQKWLRLTKKLAS